MKLGDIGVRSQIVITVRRNELCKRLEESIDKIMSIGDDVEICEAIKTIKDVGLYINESVDSLIYSIEKGGKAGKDVCTHRDVIGALMGMSKEVQK